MRLPRFLALAVPLLIAVTAAAPAQAGLSTWTSMTGLNAAAGAEHVREYATGTPPTTIYAATEGDGVFRSTNDGITWQPYSSGLESHPGAKNIRTVFADGTTVYAGTTAGLFKNAGAGWQPVAQGPEDDPKNPKKLNAAVQAVLTGPGGQMLAGVASGGVYKSSDGGATWKPPAPDNGMARAETVWSLGTLVPGVIFAATSSGIYRSIDFGSHWTLASDGISGTTLRVFTDNHNPNIIYAATPGNGVFRSINAGITWSAINGPADHALGNLSVRALHQFAGLQETRLYAGTGNGMYAGTTGNGPIPGEVKWRKVTNTGLNGKTIFWALTNFTTTPGTMLAGTDGDGGFSLTFQPAINQTPPTINDTTPQEGQTLVASPGTWAGTQTIEYAYQWQRCTGTTAGTCADIDDATTNTYVVPDTPTKYRFRVLVQGKNDFPTFGLNEVASAITSPWTANPGSLPGANQSSTASIEAISPNPSLPQSGGKLRAKSWSFNPAATSTAFQWLRCDANGNDCAPIPGADELEYPLTDADVGTRLCVTVTGTNAAGSTTLGCSGVSNVIFPQQATQTVGAKVIGSAYVGDTLVSDVGQWKYPGTTFARRWMRCNAEGASCEYISGATSSAYVIKDAELGDTLRVEITADTNGANVFPAPVSVMTAPTAVVTTPPPPAQDPQGGNGAGNGGGGAQPQPQPSPQPQAQPQPDVTAPVLSSLGAVSSKLKPGAQLKLKVGLSEGGTLAVKLERVKAGRKVGKKCKAGAKKGKKCTVYTKVASYNLGVGGSGTVSLPKKKLAAGDYRATVTPIDAAGNKGAPRMLKFKVTKK